MQLKIHIQEQSYYPMMDDDYIPVAANSETVLEILDNNPYTQRATQSSEHILFLCPLSVTIITPFLIAIALMLYACRGIVKFNSSVKAKLKGQ
jgi:hypothetical protein